MNSLQFAEDLVLMSQSALGLQNALHQLENYCSRWNLAINTDKTKVLIFNNSGRTIKSVRFSLYGELLENVHNYCYLGVMFSASGSFTNAYKHLYDKASRALFKLKQINVHSNVPVALKLFDSLVAPIVTYCSEIWGAFLFKLIPDNDFFSACEQFPIECLLTKFANSQIICCE